MKLWNQFIIRYIITAEGTIEQGWGGDTWGENLWGNLQPEVAIVSGITLTSSIGTLGYAASEEDGVQEREKGSWGIAGSVIASSFNLQFPSEVLQRKV